MPVAYIAVNMENAAVYQAQTDAFLNNNRVQICGNDYTATSRYAVRGLFVRPTSSNPDPRPVFLAINCVSNSPSHAYRELILKEFYNGGGQQDFSASIANWRRVIDSVQAPPPALAHARFSGGGFEFTVPGQRGRTNRVEGTTNFSDWTTVTEVWGTNAPVVVRDPNAAQHPHRFYRVVRP